MIPLDHADSLEMCYEVYDPKAFMPLVRSKCKWGLHVGKLLDALKSQIQLIGVFLSKKQRFMCRSALKPFMCIINFKNVATTPWESLLSSMRDKHEHRRTVWSSCKQRECLRDTLVSQRLVQVPNTHAKRRKQQAQIEMWKFHIPFKVKSLFQDEIGSKEAFSYRFFFFSCLHWCWVVKWLLAPIHVARRKAEVRTVFLTRKPLLQASSISHKAL